MKKIKRVLASIAIPIVSFSRFFARATTSVTAAIAIMIPITIVKTVDMNFGNIAASASAPGIVVLTASGVRSIRGGVKLPAMKGTVTAATFKVSGQGNYIYAITLPDTCAIYSAGNTMVVNGFTSNPATNGILNPDGTQTLTVGATLNVAAGQAQGIYMNATGVSVTVNYN